ncbi:MAG: hypothetical protein HOC74_10180 [Gemmatimonadetes bacterium]|jgi:hypothetical protein|nr:hypothetical protein [Gemmatimonadota bacterium]
MKKFLSRKLIAAVAGTATIVMVQAGLDEQVAAKVSELIAVVVSVYIVGQSAVDLAETR